MPDKTKITFNELILLLTAFWQRGGDHQLRHFGRGSHRR
jgi:hypothetical protein